MKQALIYSLKVWLTVLLCAPIILFAFQALAGGRRNCGITVYFWTVVGESMAFIPLLLVLFVTIFLVRRKKSTTIKSKALIGLITVEAALYAYILAVLLNRSFILNLYGLEFLLTYTVIVSIVTYLYSFSLNRS